MGIRRVYFNQESSLATRIQAKGIRHGDHVRMLLEHVGVKPYGIEPVLCFCPANVVIKELIDEGTRQHRQLPIPTDIVVSNTSRNHLTRSLSQFQGFVNLETTIVTNGRIHLQSTRILSCYPCTERQFIEQQWGFESFLFLLGEDKKKKHF